MSIQNVLRTGAVMRLPGAATLAALATTTGLLLAPQSAVAQAYPTKPIRIVVGFPAGTTTDTGARVLGVHMNKVLGQPLIVEARPGAGGVIGANVVVKAEPDGYTYFFGSVSNLHPIFTKNNPIDAGKDFAPVSDSMYAPYVLFASAKLPATNLQELVAYAKTQPPEKFNMPVTIANQELLMQVVKSKAGITYTSIPYTSSAQFIPLLASGEIAIHVNLFGNFQAPLQAGTVRAIFVTAPKRTAQYPNVQTAAEAGIQGVEAAGFGAGFWAPRGTPRTMIDRVSAAAVAAVKQPETIEQFRKLGYDTVGNSPEEQLKSYEASMQFWRYAAQLGNFQPQ